MKTKKRNVGDECVSKDDFYNQAAWEELIDDDEVGPMEEAFMRGYLNSGGSI